MNVPIWRYDDSCWYPRGMDEWLDGTVAVTFATGRGASVALWVRLVTFDSPSYKLSLTGHFKISFKLTLTSKASEPCFGSVSTLSSALRDLWHP